MIAPTATFLFVNDAEKFQFKNPKLRWVKIDIFFDVRMDSESDVWKVNKTQSHEESTPFTFEIGLCPCHG